MRLPLCIIFALLSLSVLFATPGGSIYLDVDSFRMVDCEYSQADEKDMGSKNTIASNIRWERYADQGRDSAVALLAVKFFGFSLSDGSAITASVSGEDIRYTKLLGEDDTARILMLFFSSSKLGDTDTIALTLNDSINFELPPVAYRPHGVYSIELHKIQSSIDTIHQIINDNE